MVIFSANMAMSTTKNSEFFQTRCLISQCHIDTYQLPQRYPDFGLHGSSWWITPEIRKWVPPGMWSDSGISKVGRVQNSRWVEKNEYPLQLGGFCLYIWVISGIFLGRYTQQHILWPGSRLHECVPSNHRNPTAHCFTNLGSRENLHTCGVFPCLKIPDPGTIRC